MCSTVKRVPPCLGPFPHFLQATIYLFFSSQCHCSRASFVALHLQKESISFFLLCFIFVIPVLWNATQIHSARCSRLGQITCINVFHWAKDVYKTPLLVPWIYTQQWEKKQTRKGKWLWYFIKYENIGLGVETLTCLRIGFIPFALNIFLWQKF